MKSRSSQSRQYGFTLIELMIVVAVIAILAAVVYPSYKQYVQKTRRGAAAACLFEQAEYMERYYSTNSKYTDASLPQTNCRNDLASFYTFSFDGTPDGSTFKVQAVPVASGPQSSDKCKTLALNQAGTKTTSSTTVPVSDCF